MKQIKKSDVLRVSYLAQRSDIPRLEWMMAAARVPTKVDLVREALNHYEGYLLDRAVKLAELRRQAGAPELPLPKPPKLPLPRPGS